MTIAESDKFAKTSSLKRAGKEIPIKGSIPGERANRGDVVNLDVTAQDAQHKKAIRLIKKLAEGGEGSVFTTSVKGYVAKIYRRDKITEDRYAKLRIMIGKPVDCPGVCFPVALIKNDADEFVGYLMPEAKGEELGKSIFMPQLLLQKFPGWTRRETIRLCITILEKIKYLNDRRVIMGDINPANILVVSPTEVYFVDCDSYQIEGYPCPVGTANYTPPEVQGKDYKQFLRTQEMENFATATLLFMIMLPGKPPYSAVGGESPAKNIMNGDFPYPCEGEYDDKAPAGKWGFIWSHMLYNVKLAFFDVFKKGRPHFLPEKRYYPDDWIKLFESYLQHADILLKNDPMAMAIFPTRVKMKKCKTEGCENRFVPDQDNYSPFCDECRVKQGGFSRSWTQRELDLKKQRAVTSQRPVTSQRTVFPKKCKVTFDSNGGLSAPSVREVVFNERIGSLPSRQRAGFTFDGWYATSTGSGKVTQDVIIKNDMTLYAHWTRKNNSQVVSVPYKNQTPQQSKIVGANYQQSSQTQSQRLAAARSQSNLKATSSTSKQPVSSVRVPSVAVSKTSGTPVKKGNSVWIVVAVIVALLACGLIGNWLSRPASPNNSGASSQTSRPTTVALESAKVGDVVSFGDIKWRVLDFSGGTALLLSEDIVEIRDYTDIWEEDTSWESCALRSYLNDEFIESHSLDRQKIVTTDVTNVGNAEKEIPAGNNTQDKIFLLSMAECDLYFDGKSTAATYKNTEYGWWLREPGWYAESEKQVNDSSIGVRPALWVYAVDITAGMADLSGSSQIGDIVAYGNLTWRVLTIEDNRALLTTEYIIEQRAYNVERVNATWETCTLRAYLNGAFIDQHFTEEEAQRLISLDLPNSDNPLFGTVGGNDTRDFVFPLSIDEANFYFADDSDRIARKYRDAKDYQWWLRSPAGEPDFATVVDISGSVNQLGAPLDDGYTGVRPALWVSVSE
jgi:uncharacterized repeat protein (TIGR02543 family)